MVRREEGNMRPGRKSAFAQERQQPSACLKHSNFLKLIQKRIASPIAVHVKLFSTIERFRHLGSTNPRPTADAK